MTKSPITKELQFERLKQWVGLTEPDTDSNFNSSRCGMVFKWELEFSLTYHLILMPNNLETIIIQSESQIAAEFIHRWHKEMSIDIKLQLFNRNIAMRKKSEMRQ